MANTSQRFMVLDGWRGVAALLVALHHLRVLGHFYGSPLVRHAYLFVDFFFVLSGFVLMHAYRERLSDFSQLKKFVIHRFGRIYPLHIAIVLVLVLFEVARSLAQTRSSVFTLARRPFSGDASPAAILSNIFLVQGLGVHDQLTLNKPSWSISVEFWTYMVFGLLGLACSCFSKQMRTQAIAAAAILIAAAGAWMVIARSHSFMDTSFDYGFFRCLYGFFLGVLTYLTFKFMQSIQINRTFSNIGELLVLAAIVLFVSRAGDGPWSFISPVFFAAVVCIFAFEKGVVSDLLKSKPIAVLGLLSYSIYMTHSLLLLPLHQSFMVLQKITHRTMIEKLVERGGEIDFINVGGPWLMDVLALVYLLIVVGFSMITYRWIEDPGRRWFARLADGSKLKDRNDKRDYVPNDIVLKDKVIEGNVLQGIVGGSEDAGTVPATAARQTLPVETVL